MVSIKKVLAASALVVTLGVASTSFAGNDIYNMKTGNGITNLDATIDKDLFDSAGTREVFGWREAEMVKHDDEPVATVEDRYDDKYYMQ